MVHAIERREAILASSHDPRKLVAKLPEQQTENLQIAQSGLQTDNGGDGGGSRQPFYCAAAFPWRKDSLERQLYRESSADGVDFHAEWRTMVDKWAGAIVVGGTGCFHVFRNLGTVGEVTVKIPRPQTVRRPLIAVQR